MKIKLNRFYVVSGLHPWDEEFTLQGVFSKKKDAKRFIKANEHNALFVENSLSIEKLPMRAVKKILIGEAMSASQVRISPARTGMSQVEYINVHDAIDAINTINE